MYFPILKAEEKSRNLMSKGRWIRTTEILNNANANKDKIQKLYERLGHFMS